ncbi:MAG: LiaF transmembrane domain-containing protein [Ignavibacteriaceae bacterium]
MSNYKNTSNTRVLLGIIFIFIGGFYLLSTLDYINLSVPHIIFSFPFIIFIAGIVILINSNNKAFGLLLLFLGALFLVPKVFPNVYYNRDLFLPVLFIAFGIYIIFKRSINWNYYRGRLNHQATKDALDDVSIFGGGHKQIITDNFLGGNITAIFGGSEIDLTQCKLSAGENVIDVLLLFGGISIYVPKDWDVRVNVTPMFGGFSHKIRRDPSLPVDATRTLIIKGVAIFGGGEIKSYK